jgi:hypothetical protein
VAEADGARRRLWRLLHLQKHGARADLPRVSLPKYPSKDPHYRILARQRSRFTHYYFYIRDEALGPMVLRVASFLPFQTTYYLNGHSFIEQELKRPGSAFASMTTLSSPSPTLRRCRRRPIG